MGHGCGQCIRASAKPCQPLAPKVYKAAASRWERSASMRNSRGPLDLFVGAANVDHRSAPHNGVRDNKAVGQVP